MAQPAAGGSYSGIPRATNYGGRSISPIKTSNKTLTKRASVVNFQRPQPWVPANTVTPPLTPQTSDDNLYINMSPRTPNSPQKLQQQQQQRQHQAEMITQQQYTSQEQYRDYYQQFQQQQPAPFAEYWRAFYGYYPAYDAQSSTVTLPLNSGDLVLVHSIHDNGWADGTLLNSGIRGWFPTNYCEPFDPEPIRNLLRALTNFFDIVRSGAEGNVAVFCNQDYMRGLVAGVRFLLEKTACLSREAPIVAACLALSRTRKALLSDLSLLVKMAKNLQSELTATHAQPDLDESCIDDMVLRAFKLVIRASKFHDTWVQTVMEDDNLDALGSPFSPDSITTSHTNSQIAGLHINENGAETKRRDSMTLNSGDPCSANALVGIDSDGVDRQSGAATAENGSQQRPTPNSSHRQSSSSLNSQQYPQQFHRKSRQNTSSLLYSRPQTSQSQARQSFSNSRPSSLAAPTPANINRQSISHRISYASKLDGISRENLASERLTQAHESLLTCLGAFIGLHVSSRTSQELLFTTQECLDGTEKLTQTLRTIWERGYFGSESIDEIEEMMFGYISELVDAVQTIFNALNHAEDEGELGVDFPMGDCQHLTDAATSCIRAAGESVSKGRYVLEMIGDFEFENETTRRSLLEGTNFSPAIPEENQEMGDTKKSDQVEVPRPVSVHRPLSSNRLSAFAPPQPSFEPPAPPHTSLRIDTTRASLELGSNGDITPPSDRMSNGSWLPPLPRLTSPIVGSDSLEGSSSNHSFLKLGGDQQIQISPRTDSLRGTSLLSGSTGKRSKRDSEQSTVSISSTRATSPEPQNEPKVKYDDEQHAADYEEFEKVLEKTYAHELVFNKEGQITGGTLPALVERLTTADSTPDASFVSTFFLTFRLFATPEEFAQSLIDRFTYSSESEAMASPVQLRVYNVLKQWLESHWRLDADEVALDQILLFSNGPLAEVLPNASKHLVDLIVKVKNTTSPVVPRLVSSMGKTSVSLASYVPPNTPMPSPSINKSQTNMLKAWRDGKAIPSIIDFEPLELARQFTLKVSSVFCNIMPEELLGIEWTKKSGSCAINVRAMSTLSTDLANLVAECILGQEDAGKRAKVIKHWIKIAKCCLDLANYDSLIAIVCSLNSTTILRLKKTWDAVSAKTKAALAQFNTVVDCSKNYSQLRGMLSGAAPPCLPFLGMYLTDLTFVDAGNPNSRTTSDGVELINFDKHAKTARIIGELQRFQIAYRFQEVPEMQTWIQDSLVRVRSNEANGIAGGQAYYRKSLLLEPRTESRIPGAPSPALSQGAWSPTDDKPKGSMKDFQSMLRGVMKRENSNFEGSRGQGFSQE